MGEVMRKMVLEVIIDFMLESGGEMDGNGGEVNLNVEMVERIG